MKILVPLVMIILCTIAGCTPGVRPSTVDSTKYKPYIVKMQPIPSQNELKIKSTSQGYGKANKKDGYVGFDRAEYGTITFSLEGKQAGDQCAPTGKADWVITQIALSDKGDPVSEKGTNFNNLQQDWLVNAFPGTDKDNGVLYSAAKADATSSVAIFDWNDHPFAWGPKIAYYEVTASECGASTKTLKTDPGIGNTGK